MAALREDPSSSNVRDLIFAYERQSSSIEPLENYEGRQRGKSIGNALSYKLFRQPNLEIYNPVDIEKELVKIEAHLNYYEVYEKETHVAFQEQLFNVLTSIVGIDPEGHETTIQKKRELIVETQKLAKALNAKLPFDGNHSYRGVRKTYSNVVRREEAVVSTTSVRTQEHRAILSSSQSTLNGGFKSEESLNFTKDSVDLSSPSVNLSKVEDKADSATPTPQTEIVNEPESSFIPTVSRLKKFFSFRRNDKSEVKVIPAAYSGVTRSQSLNLRTNNHTVTKRGKNEGGKEENILSENDEDIVIAKDQHVLLSSSTIEAKDETIHENHEQGNIQIGLYVEPAEEIKEYRDVQREAQHNVSVHKLKTLFEGKRKETDEGNYMNFTGLLRNVDIHKKVDLNKSKSMSDLKSDGFRYEIKDIDIDDLSKEIDDNDDFEHVTINVGREGKELNNNTVKTAEEDHASTHISEEQKITSQSTETFSSGKVEVLKQSFESLKITGSSTEHKNDDIRHVFHKTIDPIPYTKSNLDEPIPKISMPFPTNLSHSENVVESSSSSSTFSTENNNEDVKHLIYRTVEPIPNLDRESKMPVLTVPIQLKTGVSEVSHSQEITDNFATKGSEHGLKVEESMTTGKVETLKQTFEHLSTNTTEKSSEEIKNLLYTTIQPVSLATTSSEEPVLKIPIQLRTGFLATSHSEEQVEDILNEETPSSISSVDHKANISRGSVEVLKHTFESLSRSNSQDSSEDVGNFGHGIVEEPRENNADAIDEQVLNRPILLRPGFFGSTTLVENTNKDTAHLSHSEQIIGGYQESKSERVPAQLRINDNVATYDNKATNSMSAAESVRLYNGNQTITEETAHSKENINSGRVQLENRTESSTKILESPTEFTKLFSGSLHSTAQKVSNSSKVSVAYSQKTSVQHTSSTHVSHQIVSSSSSSHSSELSSQKHLHILKDPYSYSSSPLRNLDTSNEDSELSIAEVEDNEPKETPKVNLSVSQENIFNEILRDNGVLENVEEEFERALEEN